MSNRARVIYQSEALFIGTSDATGHHYSTSSNWDSVPPAEYKTHAKTGDASVELGLGQSMRTGIMQLRRVQSANYSFSINRQDVNQFGQLGRIDSVSVEAPTVTLDFSYYLTNGINEKLLGFSVTGDQAITDEVLVGRTTRHGRESKNPIGRNYFILTTEEGTDAVKNSKTEDTKSVIALGNGFVTNYSIEAAVGGMPTASVTVDGLNLRSYTGTQSLDIPAINTIYGTPQSGIEFSLPPAISGKGEGTIGSDEIWGTSDDYTGLASDLDDTEGYQGNNEGFGVEGVSCLRPGDISLKLGAAGGAGGFQKLPFTEATDVAAATDYESSTAHIQSFSIDVPINRSTINRLGNPYGYAKVVDFPVEISVSISAILSDLQEGNVAEMLFDQEEHDLQFVMREPTQSGNGPVAMSYIVKGAKIQGESYSSSIGDNKTVEMTFTAQLGGPEDKFNGLFISGSRNATGIQNYYA